MPGVEMREPRRRVLQGVCSLCVFVYLGAVIGRSSRVTASGADDLTSGADDLTSGAADLTSGELLSWHERAPKSVDYGSPDYGSQDYGEEAATPSTPPPTPGAPPGTPATPGTPGADVMARTSPRFAYVTENPASSKAPNEPQVKPTKSTPSDPLLKDIFISVKTSGQFHETRLAPILDTWWTLAKQQTWFFTDVDDEELQQRTNGHAINTNCSSSHRRDALCCKMAVEYDVFMDSGKKWFCHFDDDNYVNTARLGELLAGYSHQQDWYLGKNSIRTPLQIMDRAHNGDRISFWFGTGGAGFCISRALALKMSPFASGGRFMRVGDKIRLPDDVTMGYIIEHLLKTRLTVVDEFHSHLEQLKFIQHEVLDQQISFSYSKYADEMNVVDLNTLDEERDPTRFYSLHCLLHPGAKFCPH